MHDEMAAKKRFNLGFLFRTEDWWTVWLGAFLIVLASVGVITAVPRLKGWSTRHWRRTAAGSHSRSFGAGCFSGVITAIAYGVINRSSKEAGRFSSAFLWSLCFDTLMFSAIETLKHYGFSDVIWALVFGLIISNVFGKPRWLVPALQTELFIKTGLVVMGAELLFNRVNDTGFLWTGGCLDCTAPWIILYVSIWGSPLKMHDKSLVATIAAHRCAGFRRLWLQALRLRPRKKKSAWPCPFPDFHSDQYGYSACDH